MWRKRQKRRMRRKLRKRRWGGESRVTQAAREMAATQAMRMRSTRVLKATEASVSMQRHAGDAGVRSKEGKEEVAELRLKRRGRSKRRKSLKASNNGSKTVNMRTTATRIYESLFLCMCSSMQAHRGACRHKRWCTRANGSIRSVFLSLSHSSWSMG